MLIACVFTYSLLLLFVFACCVAFEIQLRNRIWVYLSIPHSPFLFFEIHWCNFLFKKAGVISRWSKTRLFKFRFSSQHAGVLFCFHKKRRCSCSFSEKRRRILCEKTPVLFSFVSKSAGVTLRLSKKNAGVFSRFSRKQHRCSFRSCSTMHV